MNKIELIREIVMLWRERVLDNDEAIIKIEKILGRKMEEDEMPQTLKVSDLVEPKKKQGWKRFSELEKQFIQTNYRTMLASEIAEKLGRTTATIYGLVHKWGMKKANGYSPKSSFEEKRRIIKEGLRIGTPRKKLAKKVGMTLPTLKHQIRIIRGFRN